MNILSKNNLPPAIDSKPTDNKSSHDFVRSLIRKGIVEINPYLDKTGIKYPDAEDYFKGYTLPMITNTLESLTEQGVLNEKAAERVLICPICNSPEVHSKFLCPRCDSDAVGLTKLLEHKECGYIGNQKAFLNVGSLTCPRCGTTISKEGSDYHSIGNFYQCEKCSNIFDKPAVIHVCQNCGKTSTFQDIIYIPILSYKVDNNVLNALTSEFPLLENLSVFLENKGFRVKLHDTITGISGTQSHFDLFAEKGSIRILLDASIEGKKSEAIAFMAKKIDVNPTKALLLDLSGGNELATLGRIYGIDVFIISIADALVNKEVPKELENFLSNLVIDSKGKS
jgi:predicted RNA-binding Zn-ribbon protein involved in translation (DUF1610 family)